MIKRLLIIPARENSKRIPLKNIKLFCGKPIISYVINNAKKSKLFSEIHVSTESDKIKNKVEKLGLKINFKRPVALSKDNTPVIDVLKFVYKKYKKLDYVFDEVWTISPCSPLLISTDLTHAAYRFKKMKKKVLLAVTRYGAPVHWAFVKDKKNNLKPLFKKKLFSQSQSFAHTYHDAGSFAAFPSYLLDMNKIYLENKFVAHELPPERAVDIDELENWNFAEFLYKAKAK